MRPQLEGKLVRLRAREPADEAAAYRWMEDPDVILWNGVRYPRSRAAMRERIEIGSNIGYAHARFAIVTLAEDEVIGDVALHAEEPESRCAWVGMMIGDPNYRSRGYGSDALRTACRFGFDMMNLNRIELEVMAENYRARKSYERVGFKEEGCRRKAVFSHGRYLDLVVMGMLRDELVRDDD